RRGEGGRDDRCDHGRPAAPARSRSARSARPSCHRDTAIQRGWTPNARTAHHSGTPSSRVPANAGAAASRTGRPVTTASTTAPVPSATRSCARTSSRAGSGSPCGSRPHRPAEPQGRGTGTRAPAGAASTRHGPPVSGPLVSLPASGPLVSGGVAPGRAGAGGVNAAGRSPVIGTVLRGGRAGTVRPVEPADEPVPDLAGVAAADLQQLVPDLDGRAAAVEAQLGDVRGRDERAAVDADEPRRLPALGQRRQRH